MRRSKGTCRPPKTSSRRASEPSGSPSSRERDQLRRVGHAAREPHRMVLTVMAHNRSAVAPYEESGFVVQETRRDSMLVEGNYVDEYYMARLLD